MYFKYKFIFRISNSAKKVTHNHDLSLFTILIVHVTLEFHAQLLLLSLQYLMTTIILKLVNSFKILMSWFMVPCAHTCVC